MLVEMMKRLRNVPTVVAVAALILDILIFANVIDLPMREDMEAYIQRALEILVALGILNNPTTVNPGYRDDK